MLQLLSLKDFVIVPSLVVEASSGLTCLTGETGAGKSILIDALELVLGARSDTGLIREGAQRTEVCAEFDVTPRVKKWLSSAGLDETDIVILRRTVDIKGRSRAWINATPVTVSQIRELGERLVDIHGQHAHQSLLKTSYQLQLVDGFGGTQPLRLAVREAWLEWQERVRLLNQATQNVEQQQAEAERLGWINELFDELDPREGQWEELSKEHSLLSNGAEIVSHIRAAADALSQGDVTAVGLTMQAQADLSAAAKFDPELAQYEESLSEASAILEDISRDLSHRLDRFNVDESRFTEIDERLSMYWKLSRKLHRAPEDLFAYRLEVKARLEELAENADIELLEENEKRAKEVFLKRAAALTQARMKAAQDLSKAVTDEMQHLSMTGGCLQITLPQCDPWAGGMERCEFLGSGHRSHAATAHQSGLRRRTGPHFACHCRDHRADHAGTHAHFRRGRQRHRRSRGRSRRASAAPSRPQPPSSLRHPPASGCCLRQQPVARSKGNARRSDNKLFKAPFGRRAHPRNRPYGRRLADHRRHTQVSSGTY